jgi:hypothetical protein
MPRATPYLPTEEEIAQETAKIRAGWSSEDHIVRSNGRGTTKGIGIKVISTSTANHEAPELDEGLCGWQYLTKEELKERRTLSAQPVEPEDVPQEELDEREQFVPSAVDFG